MMRYMPPRAFMSFGNMTLRDPEQLLDQMNKV